MIKNCAILLGAGVSIDAGIPSSLALTKVVYDKLNYRDYGNQSVLFGYVISKLIGRKVLAGGSPFESVNIEEAFDAIMRLIGRESDIISEFVYSWDPILDSIRPQFDEKAFVNGIVGGIVDQSRSLNRSALTINQGSIGDAAKVISQALGSGRRSQNALEVAGIYIDILVDLLSAPTGDVSYLDGLASFADSKASAVATLNYDVLLEDACRRCDVRFSYGLQDWKDQQVLSWSKDDMRLFKLHGSINWKGAPDTIKVQEEIKARSRWERSNALMIFGGQNAKLTPQGPFLQLRHHFENALMKCERLLIAGYSFGDDHVNAMVNRWVATRKKAKMIIVEPGDVPFHLPLFAKSYRYDEEKIKTVDIVHIKNTAAKGMAGALKHLQAKIETKIDTGRNGALPHILINRVDS